MLCRCSRFLLGLVSLIIFSTVQAQTPSLKSGQHLSASDLVKETAAADSPENTVLRHIEAELRRSPDDPIILNNLAVRYAALGRMEDAIKAELRSVALDGKIAATRLNLAGMYDRLGMRDKALAAASAAAELDPTSIRIRRYVCELTLLTGRDAKAVECFRQAASEFSGEIDLQVKLAAALLKSERFDEARAALAEADSSDPNVINVMAVLHYRLKDFDRSAALLKQAVEHDPDDPLIRFNLGMAYLAVKNRAAALSQYNLIKESHPKLAGRLYRSIFQKYIVDARH